ncbi:cytochrome C [Marinifilum breve]|uniref:Quinol:cytochrome c oxidoreductase monoheme cytochrome subunit n=2 Tax=Marinifilum TaxID=866673 RepID=A0A419X7D7_9BACT|nr:MULTISPECIES: cytochrome c [Marinifilum]PXY00706.1 cytochrome C [Marinifilum breve]RKE03651.1 quinol:cytochrome c oxidoreductase monoheme cytochrome subunit [Marinifilum flexuosum]
MRKKRYISILALLLIGVMISCDKDNNHPGYSYFPDMQDSRAYETYSSNPNFADGKTLRLPVEGTIPREMIPYDFEKTPENRTWAGQNIVNMTEMSMEDVARGKELFGIFCINCHGEKGDGQGFLYTSGKYPYEPKSLVTDILKSTPRGEFFHVITAGYGVMGAHGPQIKPDDRWKIIEYIKVELQGKNLNN